MEDMIKGIPEFEGNLLDVLFERLAKPEIGVFTKTLNYHCLNLITTLCDIYPEYNENIQLSMDVKREDPNIIKGRLISINALIWKTFEEYTTLLVSLNYTPFRLNNKFNEFLESINFHEAYGTSKTLFSLFGYSKHVLLQDVGFYPRAFISFDFLRNGGNNDKLLKGLSKYTPEYIPFFNMFLIPIIEGVSSLLKLESKRSEYKTSDEYYNHLDEKVLALTLSLFVFYQFAEIDEDYLCQFYKLRFNG